MSYTVAELQRQVQRRVSRRWPFRSINKLLEILLCWSKETTRRLAMLYGI